jgi:hypothetical protein
MPTQKLVVDLFIRDLFYFFGKGGLPMKRIILPNAPALAKTPRLTSGNPNEDFVLAITMSLSSVKVKIETKNQLTTISNPPPRISRIEESSRYPEHNRLLLQ